MRLLALSAWLAIAGVLAGCVQPEAARPVQPLHAGYLMADRNCATVSALPTTPLNMGQKHIIHLGGTSPCIRTQAGINEPAALLGLPVSGSIYYVTVRIWRGQSILVPYMELLDGKRQLLRALTYKDMKRMGGALTVTFFIKPDKTGPVYLLLYPDPALVGKQIRRLQQGVSANYYVFFDMFYGTEQQATVVFSEEGTLEVNAVKYESVDLDGSE